VLRSQSDLGFKAGNQHRQHRARGCQPNGDLLLLQGIDQSSLAPSARCGRSPGPPAAKTCNPDHTMKLAIIILSIALVAAFAAAILFAVSANAATERADTLESQLFSVRQKESQELNVKMAEATGELEASNRQNQQLKSDLEASRGTIQSLSRRVEELTLVANKGREMPVKLVARKAPDGGLVLQIQNLASIALPIKGKLINPALNRTNSFEVTLDPARITPSLKDVDQVEGQQAMPGDLVELQCEGHASLTTRFQ
jgi:hypothetical protein